MQVEEYLRLCIDTMSSEYGQRIDVAYELEDGLSVESEGDWVYSIRTDPAIRMGRWRVTEGDLTPADTDAVAVSEVISGGRGCALPDNLPVSRPDGIEGDWLTQTYENEMGFSIDHPRGWEPEFVNIPDQGPSWWLRPTDLSPSSPGESMGILLRFGAGCDGLTPEQAVERKGIGLFPGASTGGITVVETRELSMGGHPAHLDVITNSDETQFAATAYLRVGLDDYEITYYSYSWPNDLAVRLFQTFTSTRSITGSCSAPAQP